MAKEKAPSEKSLTICDECESEYHTDSSRMGALCPNCSHLLYGYDNCTHQFENGRCIKCYWNGSVSEFLNDKIEP